MKKPEAMTQLRAFLRPLYAATQKEIDWTCPNCDKHIAYPNYVYVKLAFCPKCGQLILAGATDGYDWVS